MYSFIFVSDFFVDEYSGGAELTSEAIIDNRPDIYKIKSKNLTQDFIENNKEKTWIFGNFTGVEPKLLLSFSKMKIKYHIIEYDFKLCRFRSPGKHAEITGECDCHSTTYGKLMSIFFHNAKGLWFMSEKQLSVYTDRMPFLDNKKIKILSSVFNKEHLEIMEKLNQEVEKNNNKFLILGSSSWIKGTDECITYANKNNLKYEIVSGMSYIEFLKKIRQSKGLIFLPKASDTCPRIVIEAKILGCELHLNKNVLHKDEEWFKDEKIIEYLKNRRQYFWSGVES